MEEVTGPDDGNTIPSRTHPTVLLAGLRGVEVGRILLEGGRASAFLVDGRRLVTCRHVLHSGKGPLPEAQSDIGRTVQAEVLGRSGRFQPVRGKVVRAHADIVIVELERAPRERVRKVPVRVSERREQPRFAIFGFGNDNNGSWAYALIKQEALQLTPDEIAREAAMDTYTLAPLDGLRPPRWGDSGAPVFRRWGPFFRLVGVLQYVVSPPVNEAGFIPLAEVLPARFGRIARRLVLGVVLLALPVAAVCLVLYLREPKLLLLTAKRTFVALDADLSGVVPKTVNVGSTASSLCGKRLRASAKDSKRLSSVKPCVWLEESPEPDRVETFAKDGAVRTYIMGEPSPRCAVVCRDEPAPANVSR